MRRLLAILLLAPSLALAEPASVARVHDGDTVSVWLGGSVVMVRVAHLDTPETGTRAKCEAERIKGEAATAHARALMPIGQLVDIRPTGQREKWGRLLADVWIEGVDLAADLKARGLGVAYEARTKPDWCG